MKDLKDVNAYVPVTLELRADTGERALTDFLASTHARSIERLAARFISAEVLESELEGLGKLAEVTRKPVKTLR